MCLCSVWVYAYGGLLAHTLESDYHGIKDVARNAGEFLPCCIGKKAKGSEKLFDIIPKVFFLPHYWFDICYPSLYPHFIKLKMRKRYDYALKNISI